MELFKYRTEIFFLWYIHIKAIPPFQSTAYASDDGVVTEKMIDEIVAEAMRGHKKKIVWQQEQEMAAVSGRHSTPAILPSSAKDASTFVPPNGMVTK